MARKIIHVSVKTKVVDVVLAKADVLAVGVFSDAAGGGKLAGLINKKLKGAVKKLNELGDFTGKAGSTAVLYGDGKIVASRVLLSATIFIGYCMN